MPFIYAALALLISINILLGLPYAANLAQTSLASTNLPGKKIIDDTPMVAGIAKKEVIPVNKGFVPPIFSGASIVAQDLESGFIYYQKDMHKQVPIASTTKIMTGLIGVETFKANDVLTVPDLAMVTGSTMGLKPGEQLTFRSLLYGMLLNSGNDAAFTIAANFPGGVPAFVQVMNNKVIELSLSDTHFDNPAGFDSPRHYSSASDLAKITTLALQDYQLARVVSTKETTVSSMDKTVVHSLKNVNKLLDQPGVIGVKTGYTPEAKENLVGLVERDNHKILTVVLGSDDRFGETQKLMDWVFANFSWDLD